MHRHVPLHSGAVAEANVLPQVLTTMRGSSSGSITGVLWKHHRVLWPFLGIWHRAASWDAWSGGQDSGTIRSAVWLVTHLS